jgi:hypothetical protein
MMMKIEACSMEEKVFTCTDKERLHVIPGIWVNGKTYWMKLGTKEIILNEGISLHLKEEQNHKNIRLFHVEVTNHHHRPVHAKLLIQHRNHKMDHNHFSFVSPSERVVYHCADNVVHLVNGQCKGKVKKDSTVLPLWNIYQDNIWTCSKLGKIQYRPMALGVAVSLLVYDCKFEGKGTFSGKSWIISGKNEAELVKLNESLLKTH